MIVLGLVMCVIAAATVLPSLASTAKTLLVELALIVVIIAVFGAGSAVYTELVDEDQMAVLTPTPN